MCSKLQFVHYDTAKHSKYNAAGHTKCYIKKDLLNDKLVYNSVSEWDSIWHMTLIPGLEEGFGITMETDDIIDFGSNSNGIKILKKYNINI